MRSPLPTSFLSVVLLAAAPLAAATGEPPALAAPEGAFASCAACHGPAAAANPGPDLRGVMGRPAGRVPGFRYSRAMRNARIVWDAATLDAFLANPQAVVPGTTMPYAGEPDAGRRAEIIAALAALQ